jgi:hypothetical protein
LSTIVVGAQKLAGVGSVTVVTLRNAS